MGDSYKFFENKSCQYYPCHKETEQINCLFCFCPLYVKESCPGNYKYIDMDGKQTKDCSDCTFPHKEENYEKIMKLLG